KDKADSTGDLPRMGGRYLLAVGVGRGQLYAFRHHDQTEMLPAEFAGTNGIAHSFTSERNLRNQNDMRPSSNSRMQRDPACIAAHHLDEHHSMMALRRGVQAVDRFRSDHQGGVKAERNLRGIQIVVDGLRYSHDVGAFTEKITSDVLGAISADHDHGIDAE